MTGPWRLIVGDGTRDALDAAGARNMAVDDVLFDSAKAGGEPTLRFYRWAPACVSLGRNQPARGRYDVDGRSPGVDIVRRLTGGLAVFHDDELTYSVTCSTGLLGSPRETYVAVHRAIAHGIAGLGIAAQVAPLGSRAPDPKDPLGVCFAAPAHGEILAAAGKLVGSAQRTENRTILQHGSILIDGSQDRAAAGQIITNPQPPNAPRPYAPATTLKALLGRVPADHELMTAITEAFESEIGIRFAPGSLSVDEVRRLPVAEAHYRSIDWTWRT